MKTLELRIDGVWHKIDASDERQPPMLQRSDLWNANGSENWTFSACGWLMLAFVVVTTKHEEFIVDPKAFPGRIVDYL